MTKIVKKTFLIVSLTGALFLPAYADSYTGNANLTTFTNTAGDGTTTSANSSTGVASWSDPTFWTVEFNASSFFAEPSPVDLGSITLTNLNAISGSPQTFTGYLNPVITFTNPNGGNVSFSANKIQLAAQPGNGNGDGDTLNLVVTSLPGPQTFTAGGVTYTVTLDGFYTSGLSIASLTPETSLSVSDKNAGQSGDAATVYLWASIQADSAVPEPSALLLLVTIVAAIAMLLRRRLSEGRQAH